MNDCTCGSWNRGRGGSCAWCQENNPALRRYAAFACERYYPLGGWGDFVGSWDDLEEARKAAHAARTESCHVVDLTSGEVVYEG